MKKIDLGQTINTIANLGVIAGIVFLAIELRQNNKQLELQSYQSWVSANVAMNMAASDPVVSGLLAQGHSGSSNLSEETYISYALYNMSVMQMAQSVHYLYRSNSLDENLWRAEINRAAGILASPGVRAWWDAGGKTQLTPEFVELIESIDSDISIWCWDSNRGYFSGGVSGAGYSGCSGQ